MVAEDAVHGRSSSAAMNLGGRLTGRPAPNFSIRPVNPPRPQPRRVVDPVKNAGHELVAAATVHPRSPDLSGDDGAHGHLGHPGEASALGGSGRRQKTDSRNPAAGVIKHSVPLPCPHHHCASRFSSRQDGRGLNIGFPPPPIIGDLDFICSTNVEAESPRSHGTGTSFDRPLRGFLARNEGSPPAKRNAQRPGVS